MNSTGITDCVTLCQFVISRYWILFICLYMYHLLLIGRVLSFCIFFNALPDMSKHPRCKTCTYTFNPVAFVIIHKWVIVRFVFCFAHKTLHLAIYLLNVNIKDLHCNLANLISCTITSTFYRRIQVDCLSLLRYDHNVQSVSLIYISLSLRNNWLCEFNMYFKILWWCAWITWNNVCKVLFTN